MYSTHFQNLVNESYRKSIDLYGDQYPFLEADKMEPNPYYIGFGNPNSKILIIGKEKAFDANIFQYQNHFNSSLFLESIANPDDWKKIIEKKINNINYKYYPKSSHFNSALQPYNDKKPESGHTWSKYQKLINHLSKTENVTVNSFFLNSFITEVNFRPSKLSKKPKEFGTRLEFLKHPFYQSFPVVILACGNYLSKKQIENIFNVRFKTAEKSAKRKKLIEYGNQFKTVLNTRQLSMDVSDEYLKLIADTILQKNAPQQRVTQMAGFIEKN